MTPTSVLPPLRRAVRWYGAGPLHLLALLASFALVGYAAVRLFNGPALGIAYWVLGSAVAHDLVLVPLYAVADTALVRVLQRRPYQPTHVAWINHLRFPAVISGTLLIVWLPLIFRLSTPLYGLFSGFTTEPYFERWLLVTGALFALSGLLYALRLRRAHAVHGKRDRADRGMAGGA